MKETSGRDKAYDVYAKERESLIRSEHESAREFSKVAVTLSTAALGFSVLFVEKMAAVPPLHVGLLWAAWACFGATCLATLLSLHTSARAFRSAQDNLSASYEAHRSGEKQPTQTNAWADRTKWLGGFSIPLFVIGLALLLLFAGANLKQKTATPRQKSMQNHQTGAFDVL